MQRERIVILGAGYAGLMTALRLAKKTGNAEITLVNESDTFTERIRLHQMASGQPLKRYSIPALLRGLSVRFEKGAVTALDIDQKTVAVQSGATRQLSYDKLVYAPGSRVNRSRIKGAREHAYSLERAQITSLTEALRNAATQSGRLAIVGGGLTAIEAATEFAESYPGLRVTIVTDGALAGDYAPAAREHLRAVFQRLNIRVYENTRAQEVTADTVITGQLRLPFDVCLWAGGFEAHPLAGEAGLQVNANGQILIDEYLRSPSRPEIYAVGDAANFAPETGMTLRMACATALPMGAHAADNLAAQLANKPLKPFSLGYALHCVSLGRRDGLIQFVNRDDTPQERVLKGRAGAWVKEWVCRYALWALRLQRISPQLYRWPGAEKKVARAAAPIATKI